MTYDTSLNVPSPFSPPPPELSPLSEEIRATIGEIQESQVRLECARILCQMEFIPMNGTKAAYKKDYLEKLLDLQEKRGGKASPEERAFSYKVPGSTSIVCYTLKVAEVVQDLFENEWAKTILEAETLQNNRSHFKDKELSQIKLASLMDYLSGLDNCIIKSQHVSHRLQGLLTVGLDLI